MAAEFEEPVPGLITGNEPRVRAGAVSRRRLPAAAWQAVVRDLIDAARDVRRGSYRTCRFCRQATPPEWLHDEGTCQGCAEGRLGVVH